MPGTITSRLRAACVALWWLALLLPAGTVFLPSHQWDVHPLATFALSAAAFGALRILAGHRAFLLLTLPLVLFGLFAAGAHVLRGADVLELVALGALRPAEVAATLGPYLPALLALAAAVAAVFALAWRQPGAASPWPRRWAWSGTIAAAAALALWLPGPAARAWPVNLLTVAAASTLGRMDVLATTFPYAQSDPRDKGAHWRASRTEAAPAARETYVLVIGESVRPDRLKACGGPAGWPTVSPDRVVFCDVMAGSSSTHTAVPLLVSRELPGGPVRVSRDATVMKAFEEAGFRTVWLSVQERAIAWPDAQEQHYVALQGTDAKSLLPALRTQLERAPEKLLLVIHTYNAHFHYCERYEVAFALHPLDCRVLGAGPTPATRAAWLAAYDNAVHESTRFLDAVSAQAAARGGDVFLLYTSDHGENLLDDERGLFQHALGEPSRWDTRVPAVVMANEAWRARHAARWEQLRANAAHPLMHADLVPTLLGAAGIAYEEPRTVVADLTRHAPPAVRTRLTLRRLGQAVDGDALR